VEKEEGEEEVIESADKEEEDEGNAVADSRE
jgi:hypothetical protein